MTIHALIAAMVCALATLPALSARADPYDDCILAHVPASQDARILVEIRRACVNSTSVDIPPDKGELSVKPDTRPLLPGVIQVAVAAFEVTNDTGYRITEIVVRVMGSDRVDRRPALIDRGATQRLTIELNTMDDYTWWGSHTVTVAATKGIPQSGGWWPFK